jgi:cytochrome c553
VAPRRGKATLAAAGLVILAGVVAFILLWSRADRPDGKPSGAANSPVYVGVAACATCHAKEHAAWSGSQHAKAMQPATADTVLGDFGDVVFRHRGGETRFFRREGKFLVRTEGPDGKPGDFEIGYTFGLAPLQQYLVAFPDGRLQALGVAWDARPKAQGGQRWFHLYPDRTLRPGDPLHWTGIDQNWNYQCADCHSTNLRKNYDAEHDRFGTTWSEINVSCEACHGPGSDHVAWARKEGDWKRFSAGLGLTAVLDERKGVTWSLDAQTGNAARSKPREAQREIEVCARCHARRGQFTDRHAAGEPFHDAFRPSLLEGGLYHVDGQQRDEVYTYGSFLQSRMHARGVTCADCHDPHTQQLRAPGNGVCAQCHARAKYDAAAHHHHPEASAGAACTACHMPTATYMVVDPRHDHGFRIPRPDRTVALGTPNACNACHVDRTPTWAAERIRAWFPDPKPGFQTFAEAFDLADRGAPGARTALAAVAADASQSPIARASAVARLGRGAGPGALAPITRALEDADANVRMAAVGALAAADAATLAHHLAPLLADAVRVVRMEAARALAGPAQARLTGERRTQFARAGGIHRRAALQR